MMEATATKERQAPVNAKGSPVSPRVRLLTVGEVAEMFGHMPIPTFYRLLAAGKIPKPTVTLGRRKLWRESTVSEWIDRREGKR